MTIGGGAARLAQERPAPSGGSLLHELDDGRLAQRHVDGDPQAFGALVDRYQTRLLRFVHCIIADRERAEAIVQEVFIRVFRHLHWFDRTRKLSTWIYAIAANLARTEPALGRPLALEDAPSRLPASLRDVFVLRELEGMSYEEIAEVTECDVGTVRSRLTRARRRFARLLEPALNEEARGRGARGVGVR